jgi:hypothetical protein
MDRADMPSLPEPCKSAGYIFGFSKDGGSAGSATSAAMKHADMVVAICLILTDWTHDDSQKLRAISEIMADDEALGRPAGSATSVALTQVSHADMVVAMCLIITAITDGDVEGSSMGLGMATQSSSGPFPRS